MGSSRIFCSRFFPPKSAPSAPPAPEPALTVSASPPGLGEAGRRAGLKAPLSLPTGETPRLLGVVWMASAVLACVAVGWSAGSGVVVAERAASSESMVSEAIRGEERVSRPAWDWCGDMPGRRAGELLRRLVGSDGGAAWMQVEQWTKEWTKRTGSGSGYHEERGQTEDRVPWCGLRCNGEGRRRRDPGRARGRQQDPLGGV